VLSLTSLGGRAALSGESQLSLNVIKGPDDAPDGIAASDIGRYQAGLLICAVLSERIGVHRVEDTGRSSSGGEWATIPNSKVEKESNQCGS
jgi:hypothetical protein